MLKISIKSQEKKKQRRTTKTPETNNKMAIITLYINGQKYHNQKTMGG